MLVELRGTGETISYEELWRFLGEVKGMVRLKVCLCFRLSGYEEFMESVANRPWDVWHVINDGKRFIINYVSDG